MSKFVCPRCGSDYVTRVTESGRKFVECGNPECTFNYRNVSKEVLGKNRTHFKLIPKDYVQVHELYEEYSVGYIARFFGIGRKQVKRILNLNLSVYAQTNFSEPPVVQS